MILNLAFFFILSKACFSMVLRLFAVSFMVARFLQSEKAYFSILVTDEGIEMLFSEDLPSKAPLAIVVTL